MRRGSGGKAAPCRIGALQLSHGAWSSVPLAPRHRGGPPGQRVESSVERRPCTPADCQLLHESAERTARDPVPYPFRGDKSRDRPHRLSAVSNPDRHEEKVHQHLEAAVAVLGEGYGSTGGSIRVNTNNSARCCATSSCPGRPRQQLCPIVRSVQSSRVSNTDGLRHDPLTPLGEWLGA